MPAGTIKKLVQDKGFDNLEVGQQVEFTIDNQGGGGKGKGPRAASVTPQ